MGIDEVRGRVRRFVRDFQAKYLQDYVFVHINKTGGSSIEAALGVKLDHDTALEKRQRLGLDEWSRRFKFAFVRNPWDKVVSHYLYRVRTNQTGLRDDPLEFGEWVRRSYGAKEPRYYDKPRMFMPQWRWISDDEGVQLVDFVGRFETLAADFERVRERIRCKGELPHRKRSERVPYADYYDDEARRIVAEHFAGDVERFGYSFGAEGSG